LAVEKIPFLKVFFGDLQNEQYCEWIKFLRESEDWNKEQIQEYQFRELKRIVRYAYENTNGYRRLYNECGITPDSLKTIEDFRKLPFLTKEAIRDNLEDFSVDIKGRQYVTTAGTTGVPFGFYVDQIASIKEKASKGYQYYRIGWKEGDRQMVLRGLVVPSPNHVEKHINELRCSSYYLTPEWMEYYRERAFEFKPDWILCYPSSAYIFAKFLKETGKPFPPIKGVLCASENLYDYQKQLLFEVFKTRVFSHYGQTEKTVLAGFCEYEDTYHVLPQYGYAELIDKNGEPVTEPDKIGEIVGTSFILHATPLIRYRTGDLAVLKGWKCPSCGRPYQVWEKIEGRLQEFFVTSADRYIPVTAAVSAMHDDIFDHIERFQFYQEKKGHVIFRFIPKDSCNKKVVKDMKRRLLIRFGEDVELQMEPVEEIPLTSHGKHRLLIQKMEIEYGDS